MDDSDQRQASVVVLSGVGTLTILSPIFSHAQSPQANQARPEQDENSSLSHVPARRTLNSEPEVPNLPTHVGQGLNKQ